MVEKLARSEDLENKAKTTCESDDVVSEALEEIVTGTEKVNTLLGEISSASKEQSVGINEVNTGVAELDKVTQQNAGNAEELASAAQETAAKVSQLRKLVSQFKINGSESGRTPSRTRQMVSVGAPAGKPGKFQKSPKPSVRNNAEPVDFMDFSSNRPSQPERTTTPGNESCRGFFLRRAGWPRTIPHMAKRVLQDKYFKKAKLEGYAARSAYKLKELQQRFELIPRRGRVLDLGCAPGSWLQVAAEIVGRDGILVGVDLKPAEVSLNCTCHTLVGDLNDLDTDALLSLAGDRFDTVLSDIAPNTTGHGDDLVSAHLCRAVLSVAERVLKPGGRLGMKIFDGAEYQDVVVETKFRFMQAKGYKPDATRDVSREMYIVAKGFKGKGLKA